MQVELADPGARSDAYQKFKAQAELIAKDTLFNNVASMEIVQGLSMSRRIGADGQYCWPHGAIWAGEQAVSALMTLLITGHAVSLA